jgi:hypothetical protein
VKLSESIIKYMKLSEPNVIITSYLKQDKVYWLRVSLNT